MKFLGSFSAAMLLVLLNNSQRSNAETLQSNLQECASEMQAQSVEDFFPNKLTPSHSETWDITYHGTYKVLSNSVADEHYLLYQCGTTPPKEEVESGKYKVVTPVPLPDGVALTSTVQIPMFELLGLRSQIKTNIGDPGYISSPCLLDHLESGTLEVFDPNVGGSATAGVTLWSADHPERIIIDNDFMTSAGQGTDKTIIESGYLEGTSKARFEWLSFYAVMYNMEKEAEKLNDEAEERFDCTATNAALTADTDAPNPVAVWAYYSTYPGWEGWLLASCEPTSNFYCELADHCSTKLLHGSERLDHVQFEVFAKEADIFFYSSGDWDSVYEENKEMLDKFKSVQNKQVYDHELSGPFTWWEQRMAEYDVVLEDFCTIANMTTDVNAHKREWFRNVFTESVGEGLGVCEDLDAPLVSRATPCTALPVSEGTSTTQGGDSSASEDTSAILDSDSPASEDTSATLNSDSSASTTSLHVVSLLSLVAVLLFSA